MENYKSTIILCSLVHFFTFLKFSFGLDTLFPNRTFTDGQTLTSPNQMFVMGFFSPGASGNRYLGIWYKNTPDVVVWVANRNDPITYIRGLQLAIVGNGTLVIRSDGGIVWSANSSRSVSSPILQLLDTGNLVLVNMTSEVLLQSYLWQSFDYPTDTLLPGMKMLYDDYPSVERYLTSWRSLDDPSPGDFHMKITNDGLPDMVIFNGTQKIFRAGAWNGIYFNGVPPFPNAKVAFQEEKLISILKPYDTSTFSRIVVDTSGMSQYLVLNPRRDKWNPTYNSPEEPCEQYGKCGPFGICSFGEIIKCQCLKGYTPRFPKDWDLQDWSGGCTRISPLDCQSEDHGFIEVTGIKYPDMLQYWLNTSLSFSECKDLCLSDCSCVAYANPNITDGSKGCLIWFGELMDTKYLTRENRKQKIYVRVPKSLQDSSIGLEVEEKNMHAILILVAIVSGVVVSCFINGGVNYMARQMRRMKKTNEGVELPLYELPIIMRATNNFSTGNMIGEGGFGTVYKGNLSAEVDVAVKRLSRDSGQGFAEFNNEVTLIDKLQHRNLVRLLGCCIERDERILVYEYLSNKSLNTFIFDQNLKIRITWPQRFNIIIGIAKGLLYLHYDSRLKVIHRDLKTSNILLDENFKPKISDFGLARPFEEGESTSKTRKVVGTYGYMSPEYAVAGKFSVKSDIFSLGVILLEIVSGKKNRGSTNCYQYYGLLAQAWLLWKDEKTLELMDECLVNTHIESQVKRCVQVGLLCVQKHAEDRPDMISVYSMLASNDGILPEPKEPGFFMDMSSDVKTCYANSAVRNSENGANSMTEVEAR